MLSKRDKEILTLKKELEALKQGKGDEEVSRMKEYVKSMELEFRQKKENTESLLERIKEFTC